jgi:hypothetical protein
VQVRAGIPQQGAGPDVTLRDPLGATWEQILKVHSPTSARRALRSLSRTATGDPGAIARLLRVAENKDVEVIEIEDVQAKIRGLASLW